MVNLYAIENDDMKYMKDSCVVQLVYFNFKNNDDDFKDNYNFIQSIYMQKNNLLFSFQLSEEEFKRIKNPLLEDIKKHKYVGNASKDYYDNIISVENIDYTGDTVNMVELFLLENNVEYTKLSEEQINQLIN